MNNKLFQIQQGLTYRLPYYHKNFPLLLFWSERAGCTSFIKWFFYQIDLLETAVQYDPWVHNYEYQVYKNRPTYKMEILQELMSSGKETVKLVRNPYKRALSSFTIFTWTPEHVWSQMRQEMGQLFNKHNQLTEGFSFSQFLQYLKLKIHVIHDGHFSPQYIAGEESYIKQYIYLENFEGGIRKLEGKYRLKHSPLEEITQSGHHFQDKMILQGSFADVRSTDSAFPKFPILPTFSSFYNEETKTLVEDIYKQDFEKYSYPKEL